MSTPRAPRSFSRVPLATGLLVALLVLRTLVPTGFMPDVAAARAGMFKVVLCTPGGLKTLTVPLDQQPVDPHQTPGAGDHCAFAGLVPVAAAPPPPVIALIVPNRQVRPVNLPDHHRRSTNGAAVPRLGARAPPELA